MNKKADVIIAFTNGHPNTIFPVAENTDLIKKMIDNSFKTRFGLLELTLVGEDGTTSPLVINMQNEYIFAVFVKEASLVTRAGPTLILPES